MSRHDEFTRASAGRAVKLPWFHSIAPADFSAGAVFVTGPQWGGPTTVAISLRDRGRARLFLLEQFEPCLAHKLLLIALALTIRPHLPIDSRLEIARLGMSGSECFDRVDVVIICQFAGKRRRGDGLGAVAIFGVGTGGPEPCAATVGVSTFSSIWIASLKSDRALSYFLRAAQASPRSQ